MERVAYSVQLICRNPVCKEKLFPVPKPYAPEHDLGSFEGAETYIDALKAGGVRALAAGTSDTRLKNAIAKLAYLERELPVVKCPHCRAVQRLQVLDFVIFADPEKDY